MAHFAKVINGIVTRVIVAEQDYIDNYDDGAPGSPWIQCSYNTWAGQHKLGGTPLRKNFPSPGWLYDETGDGFYQPRPRDEKGDFNSWTLNTSTYQWEPPVAEPNRSYTVGEEERQYALKWDEENQRWLASIKPNNAWENYNFNKRWDTSTSSWVDI